jgi:hypothetical protein
VAVWPMQGACAPSDYRCRRHSARLRILKLPLPQSPRAHAVRVHAHYACAKRRTCPVCALSCTLATLHSRVEPRTCVCRLCVAGGAATWPHPMYISQAPMSGARGRARMHQGAPQLQLQPIALQHAPSLRHHQSATRHASQLLRLGLARPVVKRWVHLGVPLAHAALLDNGRAVLKLEPALAVGHVHSAGARQALVV